MAEKLAPDYIDFLQGAELQPAPSSTSTPPPSPPFDLNCDLDYDARVLGDLLRIPPQSPTSSSTAAVVAVAAAPTTPTAVAATASPSVSPPVFSPLCNNETTLLRSFLLEGDARGGNTVNRLCAQRLDRLGAQVRRAQAGLEQQTEALSALALRARAALSAVTAESLPLGTQDVVKECLARLERVRPHRANRHPRKRVRFAADAVEDVLRVAKRTCRSEVEDFARCRGL